MDGEEVAGRAEGSADRSAEFWLEMVRKAVLFPKMMKLMWGMCVCCVRGAC